MLKGDSVHIFSNAEEAVAFCTAQWITFAQNAIAGSGRFCVALSGGSTPKAIYHRLSLPENQAQVDWSKVFVFWSDERCVPPAHPDSNYKMAMDAGLASLPLLPQHIFRFHGESDPEEAAKQYEAAIKEHVPFERFDLMMLGMGDDGHTASLFPGTAALVEEKRLALPNYIPQKEAWRLTLTFPCLNKARHLQLAVLGEAKASIIETLFREKPGSYPVEFLHHPTWILDQAAAKKILV